MTTKTATTTQTTTATTTTTSLKTTFDRDKEKPIKSSRDKKIRIRIADNIYNNYSKCKNDKNWENWEKIREQKLEKMKSICFESYRQSKLDKFRQKPKPQSLDPSWYTDNIYSNRSIDLDDDYIPECLRYGTYRKLRDINENDEDDYDLDAVSGGGGRARGVGGVGGGGYILQRSKSCKEFKYPKSRSCCFGGYESKSTNPTVPKSYSFSISRTKTKPFDVIDYEPPPSRKEKKLMRKAAAAAAAAAADYYCHDPHTRCCARDRCTSSKCLLEEIYNYNRSRSNRDRRPYPPIRKNMLAEWEERNRLSMRPRFVSSVSVGGGGGGGVSSGVTCDEYCYRKSNMKGKRNRFNQDYPTTDDCYDSQCDGHHYHHKNDLHEIDVDHFIRDERSRLLMQDKFLDEDEIYLKSTADYHHHHQPVKSKSMLEVKPPSKYDEDTCSDSTEMDLEDFNFDFEKYWEELEKPPSPIDLDMQQRNMNKNLKVKNVNVGFYNNGTPIDDHHREQERLMIKKSLLEGMPSPPQNNDDDGSGSDFHYYDQTVSPFHRYSHKVYPQTTPTYKYNNFYPHDNLHANNNSNNTNPISLINNIFSIYKPNKCSPLNCQQLNDHHKPEPCKKMNVPSTIRPLGAPYSEYMASMKRPLIVSTEQPHFKIIPEKTGLKISPLYRYDSGDKKKHKLKSTARPLLFPH